MEHHRTKRSLEGHKLFPYIAWIITGGFALFVYQITIDLREVTNDLQRQAGDLERKILTNDSDADFDTHSRNQLSSNQDEPTTAEPVTE